VSGTVPLRTLAVAASDGLPGEAKSWLRNDEVGVRAVNAPTFTIPVLPTTIPNGSAKKTFPPILPFKMEFSVPLISAALESTKFKRLLVPFGRNRFTVLPDASLKLVKEL
jgi:hypothetical protein